MELSLRQPLGRGVDGGRRALFEGMREWALDHGFTTLAYGEITDDLQDERPGRRAAQRYPARDVGEWLYQL